MSVAEGDVMLREQYRAMKATSTVKDPLIVATLEKQRKDEEFRRDTERRLRRIEQHLGLE